MSFQYSPYREGACTENIIQTCFLVSLKGHSCKRNSFAHSLRALGLLAHRTHFVKRRGARASRSQLL